MIGLRHLLAAVMLCVATLLATVLGDVGRSSADELGTFRWRFAPFCNVITLTVVQDGAALLLSGVDDDCGFTNGSPATGTLFVQGGIVTGQVTIVAQTGSAGAVAVHNWIQISLGNGSGNWYDDFGNSGSFTFNPSAAPGSQRPLAREAWAYVISSGAFHASSGNLQVTHPATGEYCVVVAKRLSHKAAQATLADPGGNKIVSVGTGHGSSCNPLVTETQDAVPVYIRTTAGAAVDGNFTIVIPLR